jgi:Resolvase, N terminal domain
MERPIPLNEYPRIKSRQASTGTQGTRKMTIIGYARVSTDGQALDAQQSALAAAGAERVFAEKVSGAVTDRKALGRAIAALGAGDVLLVTRLTGVLDAVSKAGAGPPRYDVRQAG